MNKPVTSPEIDFEKVVCLGEFEAEENAEDYVSSPDLLRMVEQEDKQILPHQESVETINLGTEERKQEVKIGASISGGTILLCSVSTKMYSHGHIKTCQDWMKM